MSLTGTYHLAQACLCGYTGFQSYTAITKLQQYEEQSEKAAKYLQTAADQLHKTRTTQASGAIATLSSLGCSIYLMVSPLSHKTALILCVANSVGLSLAYQHISNFWAHKAKVPMVKDYNEAISISNDMRQYLVVLAISWWGAAFYYFPKALGII